MTANNPATQFFFVFESSNKNSYTIQRFWSRAAAEHAMQEQIQKDIAKTKELYGIEPRVLALSPDKILLIFDAIIASTQDFSFTITYRIYEYNENK